MGHLSLENPNCCPCLWRKDGDRVENK